jgi:hypothetical protein
VTNPGYVTPPTSLSYFFTARDAFHSDDIHSSDLAINYSFVWRAFGSEMEVFIQPQVVNVFDEDGVFDPHGLDNDIPEGVQVLQAFNPFTTTPVEGVHWQKQGTFGQAINENDFQRPREFRLSVGFRF